jgi:endo-1,4-beta-xylanase
MNKRIIPILVVGVLAMGIGVFSLKKATNEETAKQPPKSEALQRPGSVGGAKDLRSLKTLAELRGIRIGGNYDYALRSKTHDKIFEQEYNAMTAGIFWGDGSRPSRTKYDFSEMDWKVNFGRTRGMEMYGQTLVWFSPSELPDWFKAAPTSEVEKIMNEHIDTVVGRYAGKIKLWNVVNEAVNDGDTGTLRQGHKWAEAMGGDYIRKAFVRAHAADPSAILYYNDYDMESNKAKFDGVKALLINLKKQGAPIHALGWQMHAKPGSFDPATLLTRMNEIADLGFDNYITELDVELPAGASATDYEQQKQTYKTVVKTFLAARRHKTLVIWGLRDGSPYWLTKNHPLLFDENFNKKPAYFGVQEGLK